MRHLLGISAYYHDSAAALLTDGRIVAAAQEERFSRRKNDERFPRHAVAFCLQRAGLTVEQLDGVVFYDNYREYQGDTAWRPDSFNVWWHERPERSLQRWLQNNQNCQRLWWSGGGWRC